MQGPIRPRAAWYWVAGVLLAIAVAAAGVFLSSAGDDVGSLKTVAESVAQLSAPGETTVDAEAGVDQAIYRRVGGRGGGLDCRVRDPGGERVPVGAELGFETLTLQGDDYRTAFTFEPPTSGSYEIVCETGRSRDVDLLVGERLRVGQVFGAVGGIFAGVASLLLGIIAFLGIVIPVAIMRSQDKRRRRDADSSPSAPAP